MTNERETTSNPMPPTPPPSRRRFGAGALVAVALASAATAAGGAWLLTRHDHEGPQPVAAGGGEQAKKDRYQCPMHPSVVQDHPGECPICGMKLVKIDEGKGGAPKKQAAAGGDGDRPILFYRSPMDPKQTSPTPRKDEMGMDYVPVYADEAGGAPKVEGQATVQIDPARQQLIGLRTAEATAGEVGGAWRTSGRVAMDETRVRHVNVKIPGFVERIYVDFIGKRVNQGDPLFSLYSPELLSAQEEYLLALRTRGALSGGAGALVGDGDALVKAARRRLALWDVPESEIRRIARTGEPMKSLTFRSPVSGVVTKKDVVQGMKLEAGAMPYEIVDLSSVWVLADVYESELQYVREGMPATLTLNAFPNREFRGAVLFIDPLLDPKTRTVKVRLAFPNPDGTLRPEMFGEVVLRGTPREGLRIPQDAVVRSGTENIVFVALGEGRFEPRKIRVGASDGANVEVVDGLRAGDRVVTRANFLIDSESRLRASLAEISEGATAAPDSARVLPGTSAEGQGKPGGQAPPQTGTGGTGEPAPSGQGHQGHGR